MASAAVDNAKAFAEEQLATLRVKLNQIPALQEVEVRESLLNFHESFECERYRTAGSVDDDTGNFERRKRTKVCDSNAMSTL